MYLFIKKRTQVASIVVFVFYICECGVYGKNVSDILKKTLPAYTVATEYHILNISSPCREELNTFREAIDTRKVWSLKMLDASGEPKAGFLYGNKFWLGVKSQCLDSHNRRPFQVSFITANKNSVNRNMDEEFPPFPVNYFAVHFRHNSSLQYHTGTLPYEDFITLGLCLPDTCTTTELAMIFEKIFKERTLIVSDLYRADYELFNVVDLKGTYNYLMNWKVVTIGIIFIFTVVMSIFGTIYDIVEHHQKRPKTIKSLDNTDVDTAKLVNIADHVSTLPDPKQNGLFCRILLCFSVYTNTKSLFQTNNSVDSIKSIDGIRFITNIVIILIHVIYFTRDFSDNFTYSGRIMQWWPIQTLMGNGNQTVDTFFFLSGFLASYHFYKQEKKKKDQGKESAKFSYAQLGNAIFNRYARLTPAYLIILGIVLIYGIFNDQHSQFIFNEPFKNNCDNYWWRNLLYINNLFPVDDMCASWSWYLPNDMQFFIIAKILTVCSIRYFYTSTAVWMGLMMFSTGYNGYLVYKLDFSLTTHMMWETRDYLYISPFTRIQPYLMGIATAYLLVRIKHILNAKTSTTIWIFWALGTAMLFVINSFMFNRQVSVHTMAIYIALTKIGWGLSIGWVVIAFATGHGGLIDHVLSLKIFVVLGRLTYCAYLINPIIINAAYVNGDVSSHFSLAILLPVFAGSLIMTYAGAYVLYTLFETPYNSLLTIITSAPSKKPIIRESGRTTEKMKDPKKNKQI